MNGSKEADLMIAVMLYAVRCLGDGDQQSLREMGLGPRELDALRDLEMADLYRFGALRAHCVAISIDREMFWPLMSRLQDARHSEELQRDLVRRDAPLDMMRRLFGMGSREYTRLRRALAVEPTVGRPPEPDEETALRLWRAIEAVSADRDGHALLPVDYLRLCDATGASVRCVWRYVQRWADYAPPAERLSAASKASGSRSPMSSTTQSPLAP
jgi:hypothetical protein